MPVEPRYHTAEHIISAAFERLYEGIITDTRFKGKKVRCDYRLADDDKVLDEIVRSVEEKANEIVEADIEISHETVTREEAERMMEMRKVPTDMDPIRLVRIGDFDITPCSGEHVSRTSGVGRIEIRTFTRISPDTIRLTFMLKE